MRNTKQLARVVFERICPISKTIKITENFGAIKDRQSLYLTPREIKSLYSFLVDKKQPSALGKPTMVYGR